jgi:hypothetical protein
MALELLLITGDLLAWTRTAEPKRLRCTFLRTIRA